MIRSICAVALSLLALPAHADDHLLAVNGDVGLGAVGPAVHTTLQLGLDLREGQLALGLLGRVRLDLGADDADDLVRRRDYDEVSDYLHILKYFAYRRRFGGATVEVRFGELAGETLGHGTLLRDYANISDPDHLHAGAAVRVDHHLFELRALLDNLVRPSVVAARLGLRPFGSLPRLTLGASFALDPRAPGQLLQGADGVREIDAGYNLRSADEVLGFAGVDVSYRIGDARDGELSPYVDFNTTFRGVGLHAGARGRLPLGDSGATLAAQLEYRLTGEAYAPSYFGTFYDVERLQASLAAPADEASTKLAQLDRDAYGGHGVLAQLGVEAGRWARVKLGYRFHPGPDAHQVWLRAVSTPWRRLQLGLLLALRGLGADGAGGAGVGAMAEGRFRITSYLYALAQYARTWALDEPTRRFAPLSSFNVGVGGNWAG